MGTVACVTVLNDGGNIESISPYYLCNSSSHNNKIHQNRFYLPNWNVIVVVLWT